MPQTKYMKFNADSVLFLRDELVSWVSTGDNDNSEVLEASSNQIKLFKNTLQKHL